MPSTDLAGKTVERAEYDYNDALRVFFTDGTMLYVSGVWHNDDTAGTDAALLEADDPKSYEESGDFYRVASERSLDQH